MSIFFFFFGGGAGIGTKVLMLATAQALPLQPLCQPEPQS
jgi:hypothetical protein